MSSTGGWARPGAGHHGSLESFTVSVREAVPSRVEEQRAARRSRPPTAGGVPAGAAASPVCGQGQEGRDGRWWSFEARSEPMTTTTSVPVTPLTGVDVVMRERPGRRLDADGGGDGARLLLLPGRVVDGRRRHRGGGVDRRLHGPTAGADERRVVGGQTVRTLSRSPPRHSPSSARSWASSCPSPCGHSLAVVVLCRAVVVVVVVRAAPAARRSSSLGARRRQPRRRSSSWRSACCSRSGVRVPTATRTVTATTKRMSTAAARTIESEPGRSCVCGLFVIH